MLDNASNCFMPLIMVPNFLYTNALDAGKGQPSIRQQAIKAAQVLDTTGMYASPI